jgi:predicted phage terminase large subunit-like protein
VTRRAQLRDKDFLAELRAYGDAQRALIEAECDGFATDAAARDIRATRARDDFRFFSRTYFPHYIKGDESLFQAWFYDNVPKLIDKPQGVLINLSAPRGEAKSTLGTQLLTLWLVLTERKHFILIVMDSWDQAATMLEAVKTELTDNPRLQMDFPGQAGKGRVWQAGVILTANNRKVQAFGSGKKMRGIRHGPHRPDFIPLDDIENDENVRQLAQRKKLEDWLQKTVLNLGPPDGSMDVLYLNTILHYDSVANRTHRKPRWVRRKFKAIVRWPDRMDLWQQWEELFLNETSAEDDSQAPADAGDDATSLDAATTAADAFYLQNKAAMDKGAIVSWPSVRPLLRLMQIRAEDHHAFDCEYQNDPTNDDNAFFTSMQFWVHPDSAWIFHGVLDPSLGKMGRKGDPAAILVGGFRRDVGKLSIVEAAVARMRPELQLEKLIGFQKEYSCIVWGIEDTAFQEYFRQQIVAQSAARGVPIPAVGIRNDGDKDMLIEAVAPHVNNGLIVFHQAHSVLNTQVRHWPEADHDDGPDAVQMLWRLCLARAFGVPRIRAGQRKALPAPHGRRNQ